uniref:SLC41A/MgtE integral membrane domain-containing protein n=1 Tax=Timema shepardi TaxID=629360 RepID=A0A7R9FYZ5_TIMSH|nr:unnamed protein product [Timema shepardi]
MQVTTCSMELTHVETEGPRGGFFRARATPLNSVKTLWNKVTYLRAESGGRSVRSTMLHFGNRTAVSTVNMTKQFTTLNLPMSMDGGVMPCEGNVEVTFLDDPENGRLPDVVAETKINTSSNMEYSETYVSIAVQVFIPFLIAGFGMVGAGLVLDLVQCQAIVVGFLGSVVAIVMGGIKSYSVELDHAFLLCASSLVTSSLASFVLGLITAAVIVFSRHCKINPDNVATPIAASLGDITSLALLSWISTVLYDAIGEFY